MDRASLLAGLKTGPQPFDVGGLAVPLRRLSAAERAVLLAWHRENREVATAPFTVMHKLVALAVVDAAGAPVFTEEEAAGLDGTAVESIATEVAKRNGIWGGEPGKASPPTPS